MPRGRLSAQLFNSLPCFRRQRRATRGFSRREAARAARDDITSYIAHAASEPRLRPFQASLRHFRAAISPRQGYALSFRLGHYSTAPPMIRCRLYKTCRAARLRAMRPSHAQSGHFDAPIFAPASERGDDADMPRAFAGSDGRPLGSARERAAITPPWT